MVPTDDITILVGAIAPEGAVAKTAVFLMEYDPTLPSFRLIFELYEKMQLDVLRDDSGGHTYCVTGIEKPDTSRSGFNGTSAEDIIRTSLRRPLPPFLAHVSVSDLSHELFSAARDARQGTWLLVARSSTATEALIDASGRIIALHERPREQYIRA